MRTKKTVKTTLTKSEVSALLCAMRHRKKWIENQIKEYEQKIADLERKNSLINGYDYGFRDALQDELDTLSRWSK